MIGTNNAGLEGATAVLGGRAGRAGADVGADAGAGVSTCGGADVDEEVWGRVGADFGTGVSTVLTRSAEVDAATAVSGVGVALSGAEERQAGDSHASSTATASAVFRRLGPSRCGVIDRAR